MSIIFKKLSTLKNYSIGPEEVKKQGLLNGPRIYTFKSLIFSPKGALIIIATLFAFGLISFFALSFLKEYLDSASGSAIVVQHKEKKIPAKMPVQAPDIDSDPGTEDIPGGEAKTGFESDEPGVVTDPGTSQEIVSDESLGFKVPDYFIRLSRKNTTATPSMVPDGSDQDPEKTMLYMPKSILESSPDHPAPVLLKKGVISEPLINYRPPVENNRRSSATGTSSSQVKIKAQLEILRMAKEKRTQKTSTVTLLAEDLEEAIEKNDTVRTHALFDALAKENGQNSPYYLKLKAFKEIREENYEAAKKLLNQVLAKDVNDFDANYNMAIIEIREQKLAAAIQRLTRLKEIHPSRSQIDDLLNLF